MNHQSIMPLIAALAVAVTCLPVCTHAERNVRWDSDVRKLAKSFTSDLKEGMDANAFVEFLDEQTTQKGVDDALIAFAQSVERTKKWSMPLEVYSILMARGDIESQVLAADVLYKTADATSKDDNLEKYPTEFYTAAANLLQHPNPIVQAAGEWTIALRVQRRGSRGTPSFMKHIFEPTEADQVWYAPWEARDAKYKLIDDYARQLISLNHHRNVSAVQEEVATYHKRMETVMQDANSESLAPQAMEAYKAALQNVVQACQDNDLTAAHHAYISLRGVGRRMIEAMRDEFPSEGFVFVNEYTCKGGAYNVNGAVAHSRGFVPGGTIMLKRSTDPADPGQDLLNGRLGTGSLHGIDLEWEGSRIAFSFNKKEIGEQFHPWGFDRSNFAHIYILDLETDEITQLTDTPGNSDIEPAFLPDGGYIFASDRSGFGNQCAGSFFQDKRCSTLYRIDEDRYHEPIAISNNKDFDRFPTVLNDGTVGFMHWEYQERGFYNQHTLWSCRPDGTNMDAVYKQHIATPMSIRVVKQVPNSPLHVGTAQGHHEGAQGPVILFDPSQGINNAEAMWNVTPGTSGVEGGLGPLEEQHVAEGGVQVRGGYFIDPFPMSEKAFLVGHDMTGDLGEYGIYYIDVWGNRELLHREKEIGCYEPFPLRARQRPPVVADMVRPDVDYATVFVEDVHRDLPGVDGEPIKHLRVSQKLPLPAPTGGPDDGFDYNHLMWRPGGLDHLFGVWTWSPARTIGMVDVEEDGSAYFKVPAGTPVYLQALDEDYTEVRRMRSSFTLQRGEFRGCIGCHESRLEAAGRKPNFPTGTLSKGPQMPKEPSWGINNVLGFEEHIQPILDKHCVSCHGENNPEGGLELTGRNIGGFNQSYRSIFGLKANDPTPIQSIDIHLALHPEVKDHKFITTERDDKEEKERTQDMLESMAINTMPGQLVVISNRNSKEADITMPYQFGSAISTLTRTLLDDPAHRDDVKSKMTDDEWLRLVTWVDYNAVYYNDLVDKGPAKEAGRKLDPALVKRVPYMLPDPWKNPADINPSFLNPYCGFTPAEENE